METKSKCEIIFTSVVVFFTTFHWVKALAFRCLFVCPRRFWCSWNPAVHISFTCHDTLNFYLSFSPLDPGMHSLLALFGVKLKFHFFVQKHCHNSLQFCPTVSELAIIISKAGTHGVGDNSLSISATSFLGLARKITHQ